MLRPSASARLRASARRPETQVHRHTKRYHAWGQLVPSTGPAAASPPTPPPAPPPPSAGTPPRRPPGGTPAAADAVSAGRPRRRPARRRPRRPRPAAATLESPSEIWRAAELVPASSGADSFSSSTLVEEITSPIPKQPTPQATATVHTGTDVDQHARRGRDGRRDQHHAQRHQPLPVRLQPRPGLDVRAQRPGRPARARARTRRASATARAG